MRLRGYTAVLILLPALLALSSISQGGGGPNVMGDDEGEGIHILWLINPSAMGDFEFTALSPNGTFFGGSEDSTVYIFNRDGGVVGDVDLQINHVSRLQITDSGTVLAYAEGEDTIALAHPDGTSVTYQMGEGNETRVLAASLDPNGDRLFVVVSSQLTTMVCLDVDNDKRSGDEPPTLWSVDLMSTAAYGGRVFIGGGGRVAAVLLDDMKGFVFVMDGEGHIYANFSLQSKDQEIYGGFLEDGRFALSCGWDVWVVGPEGNVTSATLQYDYGTDQPANMVFAEAGIIVQAGTKVSVYNYDFHLTTTFALPPWQDTGIGEGGIVLLYPDPSCTLAWYDFEGAKIVTVNITEGLGPYGGNGVNHGEIAVVNRLGNETVLEVRSEENVIKYAWVSIEPYVHLMHTGVEVNGTIYLGPESEIELVWRSVPEMEPMWRLDNGTWNQGVGGLSTAVIPEGNHTLTVKLGPVVHSYPLVMDRLPPSARVWCEGRGIKWDVLDNASGVMEVEVYLDGTRVSNETNGFIVADYGHHKVRVVAKDVAGNMVDNDVNITLLPPGLDVSLNWTMGLMGGNGTLCVGPATTLYVTVVNVSGLEGYIFDIYYSFNGTVWLKYNGTGISINTSNNTARFYYQARCDVLNWSSEHTIPLVWDLEGPDIEGHVQDGTLKWSASDRSGINTVQALVDGVPLPPKVINDTFANHTNGTITLPDNWERVVLRAQDGVGNWREEIIFFNPGGGAPAPTPPDYSPVVAVAVGVSALSIAGYAGLMARRDMYSLLLPFLGLAYSKKEDKALDHFLRGQIYEFIKSNPGLTYVQIRDHFNMKNGSALYHLYVLEKQDYIHSRKEGRYRRFWAADRKYDLPPILSDVQRDILEEIRNNPGITQKDIAGKVGIARQKVYYNANVLELNGLIRSEKDGRNIRYFPLNEDEDT